MAGAGNAVFAAGDLAAAAGAGDTIAAGSDHTAGAFSPVSSGFANERGAFSPSTISGESADVIGDFLDANDADPNGVSEFFFAGGEGDDASASASASAAASAFASASASAKRSLVSSSSSRSTLERAVARFHDHSARRPSSLARLPKSAATAASAACERSNAILSISSPRDEDARGVAGRPPAGLEGSSAVERLSDTAPGEAGGEAAGGGGDSAARFGVSRRSGLARRFGLDGGVAFSGLPSGILSGLGLGGFENRPATPDGDLGEMVTASGVRAATARSTAAFAAATCAFAAAADNVGAGDVIGVAYADADGVSYTSSPSSSKISSTSNSPLRPAAAMAAATASRRVVSFPPPGLANAATAANPAAGDPTASMAFPEYESASSCAVNPSAKPRQLTKTRRSRRRRDRPSGRLRRQMRSGAGRRRGAPHAHPLPRVYGEPPLAKPRDASGRRGVVFRPGMPPGEHHSSVRGPRMDRIAVAAASSASPEPASSSSSSSLQSATPRLSGTVMEALSLE